jgi:hypothetical protein
VKPFEDAESTRGGRTLRTNADEDEIKDFTKSFCGERADEEPRGIDTNGDGVVDSCGPDTALTARGGACPALLDPVDDDGDGNPDRCVVRPPTTTVTTTTTAPTGGTPTTTRSAPPTSGPPTTTRPTTTTGPPGSPTTTTPTTTTGP